MTVSSHYDAETRRAARASEDLVKQDTSSSTVILNAPVHRLQRRARGKGSSKTLGSGDRREIAQCDDVRRLRRLDPLVVARHTEDLPGGVWLKSRALRQLPADFSANS